MKTNTQTRRPPPQLHKDVSATSAPNYAPIQSYKTNTYQPTSVLAAPPPNLFFNFITTRPQSAQYATYSQPAQNIYKTYHHPTLPHIINPSSPSIPTTNQPPPHTHPTNHLHSKLQHKQHSHPNTHHKPSKHPPPLHHTNH